jgi:sulfane dehydrogenase subunit SoxC
VPSRFEKDVARTLSNPTGEFRNSHARTPHHLLSGTVTPNSLHFSINHCGVPDIDPARHKLVIHGSWIILLLVSGQTDHGPIRVKPKLH